MTLDNLIRETFDRADEVEFARGAIASLCFVSAHEARAVHSTSIRNALTRSKSKGGYRYSLAALQLVGEIQGLPGGYWFPTPVRTVPLGSLSLVIAPIPLQRLQHEIPGSYRAGIARISSNGSVRDLPRQEMRAWMGHPPIDIKAWTLRELSRLLGGLRPTLPEGRLEYFHVAPSSKLGASSPRFAWSNEPVRPIPGQEDVYLCRERLGISGYRYALVKRKAGRIDAEAPMQRPTRVQFGIAALFGQPIRLRCARRSGEVVLALPESIPRPEFKFIESIASKMGSTIGRRNYHFSEELLPVVQDVFHELGCELGAANE